MASLNSQRPLPEGYKLIEGPPPLSDYLALRRLTALTPKNEEQGAKALTGSWYFVHLVFSQNSTSSLISISSSTIVSEPGIQSAPVSTSSQPSNTTSNSSPVVVGMGRVIGDGGWYFHIADMAVLPDHQRKGLGDHILGALLDKIDKDAPPKPYINLIADPPGKKLYARHGFVETATTGRGGVGMQRF
jgi:ribosomal protein S18 acetylase RimI-like enzyme